MLTQNPPIDRLKYIQKLYGEKQPWVVLDTLSVILPTVGVDDPSDEFDEELDRQRALFEQDAELPWSVAVSRLRASFGTGGQLHPGVMRARATTSIAFPYRRQLGYWWFGDQEVEESLARPQRQVSTLSQKLALILELAESKAFANGALTSAHEADGIFPWVARELSRLSKHTIDQLDATLRSYDAAAAAMETAQIARTTLDQASFDQAQTAAVKLEQTWQTYSNAVGALRRSGNLIAQWSKATRTDLMKLSLAEVLEKSKGFRVKRKVEHGEIVYKFKSGWTVESLSGKRQLDCETGFLSHCVYRYKDRVDSGQSVIYSLRDPDGVPYVTMEWQPERKKFHQVFGKTNSNIGDDVFNEYVLAAGQDNDPPLQPDQVPMVVEAIRSMVVEFIEQKHGGEVHGLVLAGVSFAGRDMSGANLDYVYLPNANLSRANLSEARLNDADLRGANLSGANLSGANLRGAQLSVANLSGADLSKADLRGARLYEADLSKANLSGARLDGARLVGAHLSGASLSGANLSEADLSGANLYRANLSNANLLFTWLKGADLIEADLSGVDLSGADLSNAGWESGTIWPDGFDPIAAGAVKVD
jgi:uncharacterized protein YjbI with pentapeptide repeats